MSCGPSSGSPAGTESKCAALSKEHLQTEAVTLTALSCPSTAITRRPLQPGPASLCQRAEEQAAIGQQPVPGSALWGIWAEKWQAFGGKNRAGSGRCPCSAHFAMSCEGVRKIKIDGNVTSPSVSTKVEKTSQNEQRDFTQSPR